MPKPAKSGSKTTTVAVSTAANAVVDAYQLLNPDETTKLDVSSKAIISSLYKKLPRGTRQDLARAYPELQDETD